MKWYFKKNIFSLIKMVTVECRLTDKDFSHKYSKEIDGKVYVVRWIKDLNRLNKNAIIEAINRMDIKPTFDIRKIAKRLHNGHFFFILESQEKIVGWSWNGVDSVFFDEFNCNIHLKPKHTFSYNSYIAKEARGNRLNHLLLNAKFQTLKDSGYEKMWALIYTWNKPSLKSGLKHSYKEIGNYYFLKLFYMNFFFPPRKLME